jgi:thioredoxin-related protein
MPLEVYARMKTRKTILMLLWAFLVAGAAAALPGTAGYDMTADPDADLRKATLQAQQENKRILMEVGGEWCIWCHKIDQFMKADPQIMSLLNQHYVVLKVNFSRENKNEKFLSRFPKVPGYPHMFLLEKDGKLLKNQSTTDFESGKGYDSAKFIAFLKQWAPPAQSKAK